MVPHHGTNWVALRLTAQIERDAVFSKSYGRGCQTLRVSAYIPFFLGMNHRLQSVKHLEAASNVQFVGANKPKELLPVSSL